MDKKVWLKSRHTKELLIFLDKARKCGGGYSPFDNDICFTIEEIKSELTTREHIPNKKESKLIRQNKALKC